ncbi:MAG: N-acetylmuramoyl-L-alanine amidase [Oscillospiraceae bacterium]|jgi:N-acetylmuramoyl-L-alanine amidase
MTRFKWGVLALTGVLLIVSAVLRIQNAAQIVSGPVGGLPVIIIDPGHGGPDGGAVGANGIVEKDINLSLSLKLRDLMKASGFSVVMTREEDISIHDPGVKGTRKQKTSDLRNRMAIMERYPDVIFISIHQNKFGDAKQNGAQVFYGPQNEGSKALAEVVQQNIVSMLQPENKRKCKKGEKNLYLIYEAKCPAILLECGFLSNPGEAKRLADETYQAQLAFATLCSVLEYLNEKQPSNLMLPPSKVEM